MQTVIFIPARYQSQRFPGKPLAVLEGATGEKRTLIERSWIAAKAVAGVDAVFVLTDDERIAEASRGFGADVLMTSSEARNGTDLGIRVSGLGDRWFAAPAAVPGCTRACSR